MSEPSVDDTRPLWTCPFCPLLCDGLTVRRDASAWSLAKGDCPHAASRLAAFDVEPSDARPQLAGVECSMAEAIAAAAQLLKSSRQPLFAGLAGDVAGARSLYRLACRTGAITDGGAAAQNLIRARQDKGGWFTTLAEIRTRADVIVCLGGVAAAQGASLFDRFGVGESLVAARHVVVIGATAGDVVVLDALSRRQGVTVEYLPLAGDVFASVGLLSALVAGRSAGIPARPSPLLQGDEGLQPLAPGVEVPPVQLAELNPSKPPRQVESPPSAPDVVLHPLPLAGEGWGEGLANRLRSAQYTVLVGQPDLLPSQGTLIVEAVHQIVATLNRTTRAGTFWIGGGDGGGTVGEVFTWLSGLPLRSRAGPHGLEHEPVCFDTDRLLADGAVDAGLWVSAFDGSRQPPSPSLPWIVLGPPALASAKAAVFIPVSTPGIGSPGHLFRSDGGVVLPLTPLYTDRLPTLAQVIDQLNLAMESA